MLSFLATAYFMLSTLKCYSSTCDIVYSGRISTFGGPQDKSSINKTYFGYDVKNGDYRYCSVMFDHSEAKDFKEKKVILYNKKNGKFSACLLVDRGPSLWTKRVIDVSPLVMKDLEIKTDQNVLYVILQDEKKEAECNESKK